MALFEALCRDELQNPQLYCFYHTGNDNDYWLQLGPVRTEVLYENPRIVQFYEVVHDSEIEYIKSISRDIMDRSMVREKSLLVKTHERNILYLRISWESQVGIKNFALKYSTLHKCINLLRLSASRWIKDADFPIIDNLRRGFPLA